MSTFYQEVIEELLEAKVLVRRMRLLVVCGGKLDREVLLQGGFKEGGDF